MFIRRHQTRPDQIRSDLDATKWKIYGKISNTLAGTRPDNPKPLLALCCRHGLWSLSRKPIPGWKSNAEHVPRLCFPRAWYMKTSTTFSDIFGDAYKEIDCGRRGSCATHSLYGVLFVLRIFSADINYHQYTYLSSMVERLLLMKLRIFTISNICRW